MQKCAPVFRSFGEIRTVVIDGKIYFVGIDIAKALGYSNPSKAVIQHCKGVTKLGIPSKGGKQETNCIPEGDLYRLVTHSELPSAERFESWVFDEVLPAIRKTGNYSLNNAEQHKATLLLSIYNGGQEGVLASRELTKIEIEEATLLLKQEITQQKQERCY
ncbi:MAG: Bro-N domain-containing protein [Lachnospiraceae bacterium]